MIMLFKKTATRVRSGAVVVTMLAFASGSCTTAAGPGGTSGTWRIDSLASRCVGAVLLSGIGGGLIAAATGGQSKDIALGVGAGAAVGGALCAVMAALDAQDKQRIREAQLQAARSGEPVHLAYAGNDGRLRTISVNPGPVVVESGNASATEGSRKPDEANATETKAAVAEPVSSTSDVEGEPKARFCRTQATSVAVQGAGTTQVAQELCRDSGRDWYPKSTAATAL